MQLAADKDSPADDHRTANRGVILSRLEYDTLAAWASESERMGFDSVWVGEATLDPIVQAVVVTMATEHVRVGTNIALAFPRSPAVLAIEAWDCAALSGDRFAVGIGSQVKRIIEERYSADFSQPAKRMAEYAQAMRAVWAMELGEPDAGFDGDIYRVVRPGLGGAGRGVGRTPPPLLIAAIGPLMTKVATTHADGILGHPFTSKRFIQERFLPTISEGLEGAGRDWSAFDAYQVLIVSIDDDAEAARRDAKYQIGFYGTTPNYRHVFDAHGDGEVSDALRAAWKRSGGDPDALAEVVTDEHVERYAIAGTPDEVKDALREFDGVVDHVLLGAPTYGVPTDRLDDRRRAIIECLGPGS